MWEENETYEGVFLVTFVNYGRLEYKKLTLSVETETLTKIQEAKLLIEAYKQFIDEYILDEKKVFVLGEARLINLAAAEGHPSVVMAQSFCGQALAIEYGLKNKDKLKIGVNELPKEIDQTIAKLQLEALGIKHDNLTDEQEKYMNSWQEGT